MSTKVDDEVVEEIGVIRTPEGCHLIRCKDGTPAHATVFIKLHPDADFDDPRLGKWTDAFRSPGVRIMLHRDH